MRASSTFIYSAAERPFQNLSLKIPSNCEPTGPWAASHICRGRHDCCTSVWPAGAGCHFGVAREGDTEGTVNHWWGGTNEVFKPEQNKFGTRICVWTGTETKPRKSTTAGA